VGGFDGRIGISNPPLSKLAETCASQSAAFLRVAALVPQVALELISTEDLGNGHTRIELRVANRGYFGTYGLCSAKKLTHAEPLRLTTAGDGVTLVAPLEQVTQIGHLEGWGTGLHHGISIFMPWTRGNGSEKNVALVVQGQGNLQVRVGSCRTGWTELALSIA